MKKRRSNNEVGETTDGRELNGFLIRYIQTADKCTLKLTDKIFKI